MADILIKLYVMFLSQKQISYQSVAVIRETCVTNTVGDAYDECVNQFVAGCSCAWISQTWLRGDKCKNPSQADLTVDDFLNYNVVIPTRKADTTSSVTALCYKAR